MSAVRIRVFESERERERERDVRAACNAFFVFSPSRINWVNVQNGCRDNDP